MTIAECNRFENNDKKIYIVEENKEFLNWYKEKMENGYYPYLDLKGIQHLINYMVSLYEFKYCDAYFDKQRGCINVRNFIDLEDISNNIDFDQIRYRLSHKELETLDCNYRGDGGFCRPSYNQDGSLNHDKYDYFISFRLDDKVKCPKVIGHRVSCRENGMVPQYELELLEEYIGKMYKEISLEKLLHILKINEQLDTTELEKVLFIHKTDLELRNRIFEMILYAMLYSKETIPEYGLLRAEKFASEINEYYLLNFNCNNLEELIKESKKEPIKEEVTNNSEENNNEQIEVKKEPIIKRLVKKIGTKNN